MGLIAQVDQAEDHSRALEHLSTHLVSGDGREDALVKPGYQLSVTIFNILTVVYIQPSVKCKIVLHGGRSRKQLCPHSKRAT